MAHLADRQRPPTLPACRAAFLFQPAQRTYLQYLDCHRFVFNLPKRLTLLFEAVEDGKIHFWLGLLPMHIIMFVIALVLLRVRSMPSQPSQAVGKSLTLKGGNEPDFTLHHPSNGGYGGLRAPCLPRFVQLF